MRYLLLTFLLFIANTSYSSTADSKNYLYDAVNLKIHGSLNTLSMIVIGEKNDYTRSYEIRDSLTKKLIQTITHKDAASCKQCYIPLVEDLNFDGYGDIKIYASRSGAASNASYDIWLYNPQLKIFVYHKEISKLIDVRVDARNKTLRTFYRGGHAGLINSSKKYIFKNNKLILINHYQQHWNTRLQDYYFIEKKLVNGKMMKVREGILDN